MRKMGISAVCRRRSLSTPGPAVYIRPYLLRRFEAVRRNLWFGRCDEHAEMRAGVAWTAATASETTFG